MPDKNDISCTAGDLCKEFSGPPFFLGKPFSESDRAMVRAIADLVPTLAGLMGKHCEIIVHSLEDPEHAAIAAANASLSKRSPGSPIQRGGLLTLREKMESGSEAYFCRSVLGQRLKAAVYPIVNEEGRCLGGLSIALNIDTPFFDLVHSLISGDGPQKEQTRIFGAGPVDIRHAVEEAAALADRELGENHRNRAKFIIAELQKSGMFNYRGAVQAVSELTGISPVTVYWHLREMKKEG